MDVLLCNSYYLVYESMLGAHSQPYPSLGVLYVAAYLRKHSKLDVGFFDATFANGHEAFRQELSFSNPRIVGIQGLITTRQASREMIQIAKAAGAIVIVGGPDPSCNPEPYIAWGADYVVIGEGEETALELCTGLVGNAGQLRFNEIKGLVYREAQSIVFTAPRPYIQDIDSLPLPAYDMIDVNKYLAAWRTGNGYASMHVLMSRGCPFSCEWCSHAVFGRTFRQRSVTSVINEMRYIQETFSPDHLTLADDTIGVNQKWFYEWSQEMQQQGLCMPFRCFSRADVIDLQMAETLRALGCRHIYLGVESGSQRVLDLMHKGTKIDEIRRASLAIKSAGIDLGYFIMFGYPGEMREDVHATLALIQEMQPDSLGLSIAYPVPGTKFHQKVGHLLLPDKEGDEVLMGTSRQLKFVATYPGYYYRCLIRFIETMWRLRMHRLNWQERWRMQVDLALSRAQIALVELNWPWLKRVAPWPMR